jgi:hypothetical protein
MQTPLILYLIPPQADFMIPLLEHGETTRKIFFGLGILIMHVLILYVDVQLAILGSLPVLAILGISSYLYPCIT